MSGQNNTAIVIARCALKVGHLGPHIFIKDSAESAFVDRFGECQARQYTPMRPKLEMVKADLRPARVDDDTFTDQQVECLDTLILAAETLYALGRALLDHDLKELAETADVAAQHTVGVITRTLEVGHAATRN